MRYLLFFSLFFVAVFDRAIKFIVRVSGKTKKFMTHSTTDFFASLHPL